MDAGPLVKLATPSSADVMATTLPRAGVDRASDHEAALMFEGLVMTQMLQAMRKTIEPSGLFGDDSRERSTCEYLLDQAVVEHAMSSGKGWGLAAQMEKTRSGTQKDASTLS